MAQEWLLDVHERVMTPFYHAIGVVVVRWALAEEALKELTTACSEIHNEAAREALCRHMQNMTLVHALSTIANESYEPDLRYFREHMLWACKVFDACRENRNLFSHLSLSPMHYVDEQGNAHIANEAMLQRITAKGQRKVRTQVVNLKDIRDIADEILQLTEFLEGLLYAYQDHQPWSDSEQPPLPNKPPLPHRRSQTLHPL